MSPQYLVKNQSLKGCRSPGLSEANSHAKTLLKNICLVMLHVIIISFTDEKDILSGDANNPAVTQQSVNH